MHVLFWRDLPLHLLLRAMLLSQVFLLREISESETRLTQVTLRTWFTPTGVDSQSALYSTTSVLASVNATLHTYYTLVNVSLHDLGYSLDAQGQIAPVTLQLTGDFANESLLEPYTLSNGTTSQILGPFNLSDAVSTQRIFVNATGMKTTLYVADLDHPSFLYIVETVYDILADVVFVRSFPPPLQHC